MQIEPRQNSGSSLPKSIVCAAFVEHGKCTADEFESMMQYADYSEHGYI